MKFGVQHGVGDPRWTPAILSPREVTRFATTAERVGFDAIAFTDHPAPSARWVDAGGEGVADLFTSLGFCAAVTTTVRLLTYVLLPTYRNPFVTAHQVSTLDHLSGGRVTIGLGTGYLKSEFRALEVAKQVWAGDDVTHEGHGFSACGIRSAPAAVQQPHPPLWLHANTVWATERVVRHGQGWLGMVIGDDRIGTLRTHAIPTVADFGARVDDVRARCQKADRDPATLEIINTGVWPMLDIRDGLDPERIRDDVERLEAMGTDWIVFNVCGDDADASVATLEWFATEVITG